MNGGPIILLLLCLAVNAQTLADFPLRFEEHVGERDASTSFLAHGPGYSVFLTPTGASLRTGGSVLKMKLVGANPGAKAVALEQSAIPSYYFKGSDPQKWELGVQAYGRVEYRNVYPGINLVYYSDGGRLEYDFVVAPGSDPGQIRLAFEGTDKIELDESGSLIVRIGEGEFHHYSPRLYQPGDGVPKAVSGRYARHENDVIGFEVMDYDRTRTLVIDPVMLYSTYLGGAGNAAITGMAVDSMGNLYVTGWTESTDFPETAGSKLGPGKGVDVFVAKLNAARNAVIYLAYLGGKGEDRATGIAVDNTGSAVISGSTYSSDFPTSLPIQSALAGGKDGFVAKLAPAGNTLIFSTFLGGSGYDSSNAVVLDAQGNIYIAGETSSVNFPTMNPLQIHNGGGEDAFVAKFSSGGVLQYSTYLGGSADDRAMGIAVDAMNNVYLTGGTYSPNFPVANAFQGSSGGGQNAFVTKLNSSGSALVYSTYLGGGGGGNLPEMGNGIGVDLVGNAYIAGITSSAKFPIVNAVQQNPAGGLDAFVAKLNAAGTGLAYSTYLGGSSNDLAMAIVVDGNGNACVTGYTASVDFPNASPTQSFNAGGYDAFLVKLNFDGSISAATYLGGSNHDSGNAVVVDSNNDIYIAGQTLSRDFPVMGAIQPNFLGQLSGFVAKLSPLPNLPVQVTVSPTSVSLNPGQTQQFTATVTGTSNTGVTWSAANGTLNISNTGLYVAPSSVSSQQTITVIAQSVAEPSKTGTAVVTLNAGVVGSKAILASPPAGTALSGSTVAFAWGRGTGVSAYWLDVGTIPGQGNIFGKNVGLATSQTVGGIPTIGSTLYVRLWSLIGESWQYNDYTFLPAGSGTKAIMTSPTPGSVLSSSSMTFVWNAGIGAAAYWLDVGTVSGQGNVFGQNVSLTTAQSVNGIPTNGGTIYVRLWTQLGGSWQFNDYTYTAPSGGSKGTMASPTPGSTLSGATAIFLWSAGSGAAAYWLDVGTVLGQGDLFGQSVALATSQTVSGIPTDGRTIYVRLLTQIGGLWQFNDYTYTAATVKAAMVSPAPGTTLSGSIMTFQWNAVSGAAAYWLDVGTNLGQGDIFGQNTALASSRTVAGIPTDGRTIHVRLWTQFGSAWQFNDYTYAAASTKAAMTSPTPGSMLSGSSVNFYWISAIGATAYWLDVGTILGQGNIFGQNVSLSANQTVTGIPRDGSTIYVRLWTQSGGSWQFNDYTYTAFH